MTNRLLPSTLLAALLASGCTIYFGDDGDDEPCLEDDGAIAPITLRNPETGACEDFGGYGGGGCGPWPAEPDVAPLPDWGFCPSQCEALDEAACLDTAGCRAAYYQWVCPPDTLCDQGELPPQFWGCWSVSQSGPVQGACDGLDADECSRHDDCTATYVDDWERDGRIFDRCAPERVATSCELVDCAPGYECVESCYDCLPDGPCPEPACTAECVPVPPDPEPVDPGTCTGEVACDSLPPSCPAGTVPGISNGCWSGFCIPVEDCGPRDPGACFGPIDDDQVAPVCPEGTTPGLRDGRYTGYCIPLWAC